MPETLLDLLQRLLLPETREEYDARSNRLLESPEGQDFMRNTLLADPDATCDCGDPTCVKSRALDKLRATMIEAGELAPPVVLTLDQDAADKLIRAFEAAEQT